MPIQVVCQNCGQALFIDHQSTSTLQCPNCHTVINEPDSSSGLPSTQNDFIPHAIPIKEPVNDSSRDVMPTAGEAVEYVPKNPEATGGASGNFDFRIIVVGGLGLAFLGLILFLIVFVTFRGRNRMADGDGKDSNSPSIRSSDNDSQGDGSSDKEGGSLGVDRRRTSASRNAGDKYLLPIGKPAQYLEELELVGQRHRPVESNARDFRPLPNFDRRRKTPMPLEYSWKDFGGSEYQYQIQIKKDRSTYLVGGVNRIEEQKIGQQTFKKDRNPRETTGACFFVHPDGLAITSAELVAYLDKIEILIDGQWTKAQLIAVDKKSNIALIHVDRKQLAHLNVAAAPQLQLATPVLCGGFRTKDDDTERATIQSGQISGIPENELASEFQFDTRFTAHHIGGPIFNADGQVLGVTSFVFHLNKLNPVSVGVPSTAIFRLLNDNGVQIPAAQARQTSDSLRTLATQAVCRLRTSGVIKQETVSYRSTFSTSGTQGKNRAVRGATLMTSSGDILRISGGGAVNMFVAPPGFVGVESLNPYGVDSWCNQSIEFVTKNPDFFATRSTMTEIHAPGPDDFGRIIEGLATVVRMDKFNKVAANEKYVDYRLQRTLRSLGRNESSPRFFDAELTGIVRFDLEKKKVALVSLKGKLRTQFLSDLSIPINPNQAHIFYELGEYDISYDYELKKLGYSSYKQPPTLNNDFTVLPRFERIISGAFSLNHEFLIGTGQRLKIIDTHSKKLISQSRQEKGNSFLYLEHAASKPEFYVRRKKGDLEKWTYNRDGAAFLVARQHVGSRYRFAVSPDGLSVAVATPGKLQVRDSLDLSLKVEVDSEDNRGVVQIRFSADGKQIVTTAGLYIRTYDASSLSKVKQSFCRTVSQNQRITRDTKYVIYYDRVNFYFVNVTTGKVVYSKRFLDDMIVKVVLCEEDADTALIVHEKSIKRIRLSDFHVYSEFNRPQQGPSVYPAILSRDGTLFVYGVDDILHFENLEAQSR